MTRGQIVKIFFRYRDRDGKLDIDAMAAEDKLEDLRLNPRSIRDRYQGRRELRRLQGWPEYLIDRELAEMREADRHGSVQHRGLSKKPSRRG